MASMVRMLALFFFHHVYILNNSRLGPIVRINPHEVHIHDPGFYDTIYSMSHVMDKPSYTKYQFSAPGATFSTVEHELHHQRKASVSSYYSKRKIIEQAPFIQSQVDKICRRITKEYVGTGRDLNLNNVFGSFVADVATVTAFDRSYGFLDQADFISPFITSLTSLKAFAHYSIQFPWMPRLLAQVPTAWLRIMQSSITPALEFKNV